MAQNNHSKNRIYLSNEQKAFIADMLRNDRDVVLYVAPDFDAKKRAFSMLDNSAAIGDAIHILAHGITFGGIFHQIGRASRWADVAENAYQNGVSRGLQAYKWNPSKKGFLTGAEQVVVIGYKFMTVYQEGEMQRKEINFSNVVKLEYKSRTGLRVTVKNAGAGYSFVNICNVFDRMEELIQIVVLYTARTSQSSSINTGAMPAFQTAPSHSGAPKKSVPKPKHYAIVGQAGLFANKRFDVASMLVLGRDVAECNVIFPADTAGVSRVHCKLIVEADGLYVYDLGSTYGTIVNSNKRILANQKMKLNHGDTITIGSSQTYVVKSM